MMHVAHRNYGPSLFRTGIFAALTLVLACPGPFRALAASPAQTSTGAAATAGSAPGTLFSPEKLTNLLPATVYFQGRTAPVQLRNAAGTSFGNGRIVWAALVDSSGYSTAVQEKYQFYLVTESALRIGDRTVPAGAYGGGFVGDHFLLMDLGGHPVAEGPTQDDAALRRPRPLQMAPDSPSSVRLYLGRHWVAIRSGDAASR